MGNSEVGHMNLGAGRVVYQDFTRVTKAIRDGDFFDNPALTGAVARRTKRRAHAARDGPALARRRAQPRSAHLRDARSRASRGVPRVAVHAFLDGRDTPPRRPSQPAACCRRCASHSATRASPASAAATSRWTATSAGSACSCAWDAIVDAVRPHRAHRMRWRVAGRLRARRERRIRGADPDRGRRTVFMRDGDAVVFMNFRADRARQIAAPSSIPASRASSRAGPRCRASSA
jgi:2,3-bisphosphoglycerate-independent phosphoglycerate mutase